MLMEEKTEKKLDYTVILIPDKEGGWSVEVPTLPGCYTQGETRDEAIDMARDAIELYLKSCKAHGDPIPEEAGIEPLAVRVNSPLL